MYWKTDTPTSSPLIARYRDGDLLTVVTIPYDDTTGMLEPIGHVTRHIGCAWSTFVVGGRPAVPIPEGANEFATSMLGVATIGELHEAGFAAGR